MLSQILAFLLLHARILIGSYHQCVEDQFPVTTAKKMIHRFTKLNYWKMRAIVPRSPALGGGTQRGVGVEQGGTSFGRDSLS